MATKLIENIDEKIWNKFVGLCKIKNKRVGEHLTNVLYDYLKEDGIIK